MPSNALKTNCDFTTYRTTDKKPFAFYTHGAFLHISAFRSILATAWGCYIDTWKYLAAIKAWNV